MNRIISLNVFIICLLSSQAISQNYIMLTNASLNVGKEFNNFDINFGIGFNYNQYKNTSTSSYDYIDSVIRDTTYTYNYKSTIFEIIPGFHIGYYFSKKAIRPFLQLSAYVPIPVYNKIESYEGVANVSEIIIATAILCGVDYRIDKVSIGGAIGPICNIDNQEYKYSNNLDTAMYKSQSSQHKNTSISFDVDVQVRIKYYF
jgi:hypothetical protein